MTSLFAAFETLRVCEIKAAAIGIAAFRDPPKSPGARSPTIRAIALFAERTEHPVGYKPHSILS
ncbi:MAG: hypothetical protein ACRD4K_15860 [Candidatus Acidiferrales bacterium]